MVLEGAADAAARAPHRRFNPLSGEWVQVSPHRLERPWQGHEEAAVQVALPQYDAGCYLCPGNRRARGADNPQYAKTYVFDNDFAAILPNAPYTSAEQHPLFQAAASPGRCRVVCFSPRHDLTLAEMTEAEIAGVVEAWCAETEMLGSAYRWVQVFENKGAQMGCSNPHPHGQIFAVDFLPVEAMREDEQQRQYLAQHGEPLLLTYVQEEAARRTRVVVENETWLAVVPYWAKWPFEVLLMPRRHVLRLPDLDEHERTALAAILKQVLVRYDNLFSTSFPYSMGWHGAPHGSTRQNDEHWQLHAHFYPPLLRSATVRKFMVGYEMLGEPLRDLTAEQAAKRLRAVPSIHYRERQLDKQGMSA